MFRCHDCNETFGEPKFYEESHGLDAPPYERVAICPHCESTEFDEWQPNIEKIEAARTLVNMLAALNRLKNSIEDVFGKCIENEDLEFATQLGVEFIEEMYDGFITSKTVDDLYDITTSYDVERIMLQIKE